MMRTKAVSRAVDRAQAMRDNALSVAMKRKEEFLGARVPKELRDKVTARAHEQGIPVSILIRNILEEAFKSPPGSVYSTQGSGSLQGQGVPPATSTDGQVPQAQDALERPSVDVALVLQESEARGSGCREQPPAALTHPCVTAALVHPAPAALTHPCVTRFPAVLGWEMIRLNRPVDCASCGKRLLPGASVTLGVVSGLVQAGETHIILCDQCQGLM